MGLWQTIFVFIWAACSTYGVVRLKCLQEEGAFPRDRTASVFIFIVAILGPLIVIPLEAIELHGFIQGYKQAVAFLALTNCPNCGVKFGETREIFERVVTHGDVKNRYTYCGECVPDSLRSTKIL